MTPFLSREAAPSAHLPDSHPANYNAGPSQRENWQQPPPDTLYGGTHVHGPTEDAGYHLQPYHPYYDHLATSRYPTTGHPGTFYQPTYEHSTIEATEPSVHGHPGTAYYPYQDHAYGAATHPDATGHPKSAAYPGAWEHPHDSDLVSMPALSHSPATHDAVYNALYGEHFPTPEGHHLVGHDVVAAKISGTQLHDFHGYGTHGSAYPNPGEGSSRTSTQEPSPGSAEEAGGHHLTTEAVNSDHRLLKQEGTARGVSKFTHPTLFRPFGEIVRATDRERDLVLSKLTRDLEFYPDMQSTMPIKWLEPDSNELLEKIMGNLATRERKDLLENAARTWRNWKSSKVVERGPITPYIINTDVIFFRRLGESPIFYVFAAPPLLELS